MRRPARTVAALLLGVLAPLTVAPAQLPPVQVPGLVPAESEPKRTENGLFTIPEQRDAREQLRAVMDYLGRTNTPWDVVTGTAQRLLDAKSDSFYRVKDAKGENTGAVVSVKSKVNQLLADLPKEGRQFYEQEFGPQATELLKKAVEKGYDRPTLNDLSQRLFQTKAGGQATLLLAGIDLEAGQYAEAAYGFQRLLDRPDAADLLTPRVLLKAAVAFRRSGDARQGESVAKLWARLEKGFPREGLAVGRKNYTLDELKAELDRPADFGGGRATDRFVSMRFGNASHTGTGDGGTPFLDPLFTKPLLLRRDGASREGANWVAENLDGAFKRADPSKREVSLPGFFPVTTNGTIVYRGYDGVYAVASQEGLVWQGKRRAAGELLWIAEADGGAQSIMGADDSAVPKAWWRDHWAVRNPGVLFENALLGSLSHDGRLAYYVDDLAVPPPPPMANPNGGGGIPGQGQPQVVASGTKRGAMQNYNKLVAVSLDTGKLVWTLGGPEGVPLKDDEEEKTADTQLLTENSFFLGPPLAVNGRLYVLYERKSQVKLACLDPARVVVAPAAPGSAALNRYPELLWTQTLGDASTSLRVDTVRRVQPSYLAFADGVLVCPTNCGVVVGVDVSARRLLWARYYGKSSDPKAQPGAGGPGGMVRPNFNGGFPQPKPIATDRWRAAAPIVAAGKVLVSAYDTDLLQCLDLRTGEELWRTDREQDDLYVGGVTGDRVLVVAKRSVRAYKLSGGDKGAKEVAWKKLGTGATCGHGVLGRDGLFYLPMIGDADKRDSTEPQVWAIDSADGAVKSRTAFRRKIETGVDPRHVLGNLLFQDGQLFSQSAVELTSFPLIELKRREMAERLKANPNDPEGLFARGELALDGGDLRDAIASFKAAETFQPSEALRKRLRQKFYVAYTELLRNKFADGEPYLAEYAALCELPLDAEDPAERQRLLDEQLRRKALYLTILGRGREGQGRLGDAFDAYRAFASLGDNKQLVAIADEPNALTRPDVWARGRIDAMTRAAKDPAARKPLDDRVAKEWAELKAANDLPRLRDFVRVFGAFTEAGSEAQLLLADRLLATNAEDDQREAQSLLMQLWAAADTPSVAARAVDRLAALLRKRGMPEDAVGLAAQLGGRFADVVVRDGKTGAELYGELVTDKRALPHLDPGRVPPMGAYKVETAVAAARQSVAGFSLRPTGELFPLYRRFQIGLEQGGDGAWLVRVTDRTTGEERCKFPGLNPFSMAAANTGRFDAQQPNFSNSKFAQVSGQLVLLTLGQYAYCFDLAEKRELWRHNLLGKALPPENPQFTVEGDGDVVFQYSDGWQFRLARSAVLQQSYVALVTRDGLKALDPATGQELWVRTNLSPKAQIFGDGRHVFVVSGGTVKVLRALDGTEVEGVPDFAAKVGKPGATTFLGRMVLGTEYKDSTRSFSLYDPLSGKDVWRREFPGRPAVLRTADPEVAGVLNATGKFEAFDVRTGKTVATGQVDPGLVVGSVTNAAGSMLATEPLLLLDADRAYLVLSRPRDANNQNRYYYGQQQALLRTLPVNGALYAFDRRTGARLWSNADAMLNQSVVLDRFEELPVLVAAAPVIDNATRNAQYRVVALDKRTGRLVHNYAYPHNGSEFANATRDAKGGVEFSRFNDGLRLRVTPDE